MTIDTIIFDFGGVLYNTPNGDKLKKWLKILGIQEDPHVFELVHDPTSSSIFWDIMRGKVKQKEFWEMLAKRWKIPAFTIALFEKRMMSKKFLNKGLLKFIQDLRSSYRTAILSNAGDETRKMLENAFGFHELVDEIIISAEEGYAKPDNELYAIAVSRLGTKPERCIFVDDMAENVAAGNSFGMKSILHIDNSTTMAEIDRLLALAD